MAYPEDPYFAGNVHDKAPKDKQSGAKPPVLAWAIVYVANLIVPLILAWGLTSESGRIGMFIGILLLLGMGCRACFLSPWVAMTLVYGGWIVALSQFMPSLHIIAGAFGMSATQVVGQATNRSNLSSEAGGFIATVVTGCILLTAAMVFGLVIQWIKASFNREASPVALAGREAETTRGERLYF